MFFDEDTPMEEGGEVESETVLPPIRKQVMVRKRKRSYFYLSPYINEPSKIGRWKKGKLSYYALSWLDETKHTVLMKWLGDKDGANQIQGWTTTLKKLFFTDLLQKGRL